jgi:hypothetical protein
MYLAFPDEVYSLIFSIHKHFYFYHNFTLSQRDNCLYVPRPMPASLARTLLEISSRLATVIRRVLNDAPATNAGVSLNKKSGYALPFRSERALTEMECVALQ